MKDHMEVSRAVFDASFAATVPHYDDGGSGEEDKARSNGYTSMTASTSWTSSERCPSSAVCNAAGLTEAAKLVLQGHLDQTLNNLLKINIYKVF